MGAKVCAAGRVEQGLIQLPEEAEVPVRGAGAEEIGAAREVGLEILDEVRPGLEQERRVVRVSPLLLEAFWR